ncbi:MAG: biofilm-associated protein [Candidatus Nitrosopumilus sp. bin_32a]
MHRSSTRGIFLSVVLLFSIMLMTLPSNVYGEEISVTSIALEETSLLELTNDSTKDIKTLRIWLGSDFSFKSFKTEKGWVGEKNAQGVIIFTSSESIKPGESVKFGVKTDKPNPGINWKVLDSKDTQVSTGITIAKGLPEVVKNSEPTQNTNNSKESISDESVFRIIPEKPNVGSTIRVTGDNFGALEEYDFYIDTKKIGSFDTDEKGHFMTTMKIPDDQKADRIDFKVKNKNGDEKNLSIRIDNIENRIPISENIPLTIQGIPNTIHRGDFLEIFGTGEPGSGITIEITAPDGEIIRTRTSESNSKGNWKLEPLLVPLDRPFGKYTGTISDGKEEKQVSWILESDKVIVITPTKLMVPAGEIIVFNGTALPNLPLELILEDSHGNERISDILDIGDSGIVNFEYQTTENVDKEGTWTLIATQGQHKELVYVGYDEPPSIPVNLEFDKLNYKSTETAQITLTGVASDKLTMIIIDPSGNIEGESIPIELQPDGRGKYELKLSGFSSGVYSAVIKKGNTQSSERFTVGLQVGAGEIEANSTKLEYEQGESILFLGKTNSNVLLTATLIDPNGKETKSIQLPSDSEGVFTENRLRIPSNGIAGTWTIKVVSGSNFDIIDIVVTAVQTEGLVVNVVEGQEIPGFGTTVKIKVDGATPKSTVFITITSANGDIIDDSLKCNATAGSTCEIPWTISKDLVAGTYTVLVKDSVDTAVTTFVVD